jgi:hypothetical protein
MSELPKTIVELQGCIAKGDPLDHEAVLIQQAKLSNWQCARDGFVDVFSIPKEEIPMSGALRGIGLAHKDIFQLTNRYPGLGVYRQRVCLH